MKRGHLSAHFAGVGVKVLSSHEIDPSVSRGHEFQGVEAFQAFLGPAAEKRHVPAVYVWVTDDDDPHTWEGSITWYDSRLEQLHRDPEPRMYYPKAAETVVYKARPGDTLFACYGRDSRLTLIFCTAGSTIEKQLLWLFNLTIRGEDLVERDFRKRDIEVGLTARYVLGLIGVDSVVEDTSWLPVLIKAFGSAFPRTDRFSAFARKFSGPVDPKEDPDAALLRWLELEELLFYTFERHLIAERLQHGFIGQSDVDVDGFVQFSLSVQNRRKSRAGFSLEHHLHEIFGAWGLEFERNAKTEGKRKPDFLFPGAKAYHDLSYPVERLTLLGAKSSCKDRWRQVLSEGARISAKHLITLEPGISVPQTNEMRQEGLQLVVPAALQVTYQPEQQGWLISLQDFIHLTLRRQSLPS